MKKKYRAAGLLLAVALAVTSLAGCSDTKGDAETGGSVPDGAGMEGSAQGDGTEAGTSGGGKGRFLETEVTLPEQIDHLTTMRNLSDGSISAVGFNSNSLAYYIMNTTDLGETWETTEIHGMEQFFVNCSAIAPDGSAALLGHYGEMDLVSRDGAAQNASLTLPAYDGGGDTKNQVLEAAFTEDGTLLVLDMEGTLYQADTTTGEMTKLSSNIAEKIDYFGVAGNQAVAVTPSGVVALDSQTGAVVEDETLKQVTNSHQEGYATPGSYPVVFTQGSEEGSIIYVNHKGLFYHRDGGSVSEQLINGELVSLGDQSLEFHSILAIDDANYLLAGSDSLSTPRIYRYTYDPEASAVPQKQLKVYALEDSSVLQQAITYFQKQNPDVFVKKIIGLSGGDGVTAEDALRSLSTDIMAGNGPDVLVLDGVPVESYIEKGILMDISELVKEVESADGMFENIKAAYTRDGKIYEMPARFYFSAIEGDGAALSASSSLSSMVDYVKKARETDSEVHGLPPKTASGLLYELYYAASAGLATEDGSISEDKLTEFLTAAKGLYDLDTYPTDQYNTEVKNYSVWSGMLYGSLSGSSRLGVKSIFDIGTVTSFDRVQSIYGAEKQMGGSYQPFGGENASFVPYVSVGVVSHSQAGEMAQEFVKGILGKACQSAANEGFPVNRAAYVEKQGQQKAYSIGFSSSDGSDAIGIEIELLTQEQIDILTKQLEALKQPALNDRVIQELIVEEGIRCLEGGQSVEDTVFTIMQKVKLYVSE